MYDALRKDQPTKFMKKFCKGPLTVTDGKKVYETAPDDAYCTTREQYEAAQSETCLFVGTRTQ